MINASSTLERTVGLDVSDRHIHACFLGPEGAVEEETRFSATPDALRRRLGNLEPHRVVMEVGLHSPWMSRLVAELGHEVYVANARRLRAIYLNENKSDRVDAEYLARIGRLDPALLFPLRHRSAQTQADLTLLRARDALVRARTALINFVRGQVKSAAGRIPSCDARYFAGKAAAHLPEGLGPQLSPLLDAITELDARIAAYSADILRMAEERHPECALLRQVAGVGPLTAACFVLTIEDPARFSNARAVGSYLGLRPRRDESGAQAPQLRITKCGDQDLRRLLVGAAQHILGPFGPDCDLRRWGMALAERGGRNAKKRAIVAVARKLAVLLLHLWATGEIYEPLRQAHLRGQAVLDAT
jgi:transposase